LLYRPKTTTIMGCPFQDRGFGRARMTGEWRRGVRLGIDVGTVRIGVAKCDPDGILATPVATIQRVTGGAAPSSDMSEIMRLVAEHEAVEIIVGLPLTLSGIEHHAAAATRQYVAELAPLVDPVPVRFADERMSTVVAARRLTHRGVRGKRQRAVVDQAAAVEILQGWLDAQRRRT
jgi:putative holliday junction resolvase